MNENKTSFHFGGFWFHVEWNEAGTEGTDQRGRKWYNKHNPHTEDKYIEMLCLMIHDFILNSFKYLPK